MASSRAVLEIRPFSAALQLAIIVRFGHTILPDKHEALASMLRPDTISPRNIEQPSSIGSRLVSEVCDTFNRDLEPDMISLCTTRGFRGVSADEAEEDKMDGDEEDEGDEHGQEDEDEDFVRTTGLKSIL